MKESRPSRRQERGWSNACTKAHPKRRRKYSDWRSFLHPRAAELRAGVVPDGSWNNSARSRSNPALLCLSFGQQPGLPSSTKLDPFGRRLERQTSKQRDNFSVSSRLQQQEEHQTDSLSMNREHAARREFPIESTRRDDKTQPAPIFCLPPTSILKLLSSFDEDSDETNNNKTCYQYLIPSPIDCLFWKPTTFSIDWYPSK